MGGFGGLWLDGCGCELQVAVFSPTYLAGHLTVQPAGTAKRWQVGAGLGAEQVEVGSREIPGQTVLPQVKSSTFTPA